MKIQVFFRQFFFTSEQKSIFKSGCFDHKLFIYQLTPNCQNGGCWLSVMWKCYCRASDICRGIFWDLKFEFYILICCMILLFRCVNWNLLEIEDSLSQICHLVSIDNSHGAIIFEFFIWLRIKRRMIICRKKRIFIKHVSKWPPEQ